MASHENARARGRSAGMAAQIVVLAAVLAAWPTAAAEFGGGSEEIAARPVSDVGNAVVPLYAVDGPAQYGSSRDDLKSIRVTAAAPAGFAPAPHPFETAAPDLRTTPEPRHAEVIVNWEAPNMRHRGVYFEDLPVERYGQSMAPLIQPVLSYGQFMGDAILLPYKMGVDPPRRVAYDVGLPRPGTPTPPLREHLPFSFRGLAYQATATTGIIFFVSP